MSDEALGVRRSLILVTGEEGAGKTTVMSALLPRTPVGAKIDAEDIGQVNPFTFNQTFLNLLWDNIAAVITNYWAAGYPTVITEASSTATLAPASSSSEHDSPTTLTSTSSI